MPRPDTTRGYLVRVSPCGDGTIVHVADSLTRSGDLPADLTRGMGLTRGSALVVAALLRGEDLKAHAAKAGLSENTVRFHLNAAFRATGTNRQADLVLLAARVARDLGL